MSETDSRQDSVPDPVETRRHRRRRRRRKAGLWSLFSIMVLAGAATMLVLSYLGTPITVPDWLRTRITERINAATDEVDLQFGNVVVVVEEGWKPRLLLRDVRVSTPDGTPLVSVSEVRGRVAMRPLLRGHLQPGYIRVSGVQLNLRRNPAGRVGIPQDGPPRLQKEDAAADVAALVARIDRALQRPALSALRRVRADNLTLRYEDARAGRAWNVDDGEIELTRKGQDLRIAGNFALLGARAYATTLEMNYTSRIGETAAEFGMNFEDAPAGELALQSPALAWLGALDAPISGALRVSIDAAGRLGPLNAALHIGAGVLQPTAATKPIAFSSARSYFTYTPATQSIRFESLALKSKWVSAKAEGTAHLVGMEDGWPRELQAQMQVTDIAADPGDYYSEPISIDAATMDLRLVLDPFQLNLGQLSLSDQGRHLVLRGELRGEKAGWNLALDGQMDGLDHARLMQLWPVAAVGKTRKWVAENVTKGTLSNMQLAVRSRPKHRPDIFLGFDFSGLTTRFAKRMPPIEAAAGHASLSKDRFTIEADAGWVQPEVGGRIEIKGTSFVVPDVRLKPGPALVNIETDSSIAAALSVLDSEPINLLKKLDKKPDLAEGRVRASGRLNFLMKPKITPEEMAYDVAATLSDLRSETLVPGRVLTAETLTLRADKQRLEIKGKGRLGQVPVSGTWVSRPEQTGTGSRVSGRIELSERFAKEFNIGLPPGSLSGSGQADITLDLVPGGQGEFVLRSDLAGVGLSLPQLNWSLPRGTTGRLDLSGRLGTPPGIDRITLDAPGLQASGSIALTAGGTLKRALFSRVQVGDWLDAPVELIGRGAGVPPAVQVNGGRVDLRKTSLSTGRTPDQKQGGPISLRLDQLQVSDGIALSDFRAELDVSQGTDGRFSGRVNGGAAITGQIIPQGGRSAFRIQSKDAGGVFGSAGLLKRARGGSLDLTLVPLAAAGSYDGQLSARDVWLTDAPALAALLSSLSVVGLLEQMTGNGIPFSNVDARFQLSPERVTLLSGSATGASMGISMDGYYYMQNGRMDMQGVVSPIYLLNGIGDIFTRRGEGLFGFNYTLTGSAKSPKVMVNPLSLLTPGMFREIFRRPPPSGATTRQGAVPAPEAKPPKRSPLTNRHR